MSSTDLQNRSYLRTQPRALIRILVYAAVIIACTITAYYRTITLKELEAAKARDEQVVNDVAWWITSTALRDTYRSLSLTTDVSTETARYNKRFTRLKSLAGRGSISYTDLKSYYDASRQILAKMIEAEGEQVRTESPIDTTENQKFEPLSGSAVDRTAGARQIRLLELSKELSNNYENEDRQLFDAVARLSRHRRHTLEGSTVQPAAPTASERDAQAIGVSSTSDLSNIQTEPGMQTIPEQSTPNVGQANASPSQTRTTRKDFMYSFVGYSEGQPGVYTVQLSSVDGKTEYLQIGSTFGEGYKLKALNQKRQKRFSRRLNQEVEEDISTITITDNSGKDLVLEKH